jgi:opacity protein-like surface antigen
MVFGMLRILLVALVAAAPAVAAAESTGDWDPQNLRGLYAAIGGGGAWMFVPGDDNVAYDVEIRVGYSVTPALQAYVSGALDGASLSGGTFRTEQILASLQYHLVLKRELMIYARAGVGVGLSRDLVPDSTAKGLSEAAGIGVEIPVAPNLFVAPELFYRHTSLSANQTDLRVQVVGLQLNLTYY